MKGLPQDAMRLPLRKESKTKKTSFGAGIPNMKGLPQDAMRLSLRKESKTKKTSMTAEVVSLTKYTARDDVGYINKKRGLPAPFFI